MTTAIIFGKWYKLPTVTDRQKIQGFFFKGTEVCDVNFSFFL
jgi:hypothetical protein